MVGVLVVCAELQVQAPHVIRQYPLGANGEDRLPFFMKSAEHLPKDFCVHRAAESVLHDLSPVMLAPTKSILGNAFCVSRGRL